MAIFGLGEEDKPKANAGSKPENKDSAKKSASKTAGKGGQSDEAKEILKKMEQKKDAGDCAFC